MPSVSISTSSGQREFNSRFWKQRTANPPEHVLARIDGYMKEFEIGQGDEFWLLCDCDHWISSGHIKNLVRVIQECRQKGVRVAMSYPSFELWLLLHFAEFPKEDKLTRRN